MTVCATFCCEETGSLGLSVLLCGAFPAATRTPTQTLPIKREGRRLKAQGVTMIERQDTSAARRGQQIAMTIPVLPHSPVEKILLPISQKISSQIRLRSHNVHVQALDIMASWQLSGPRVLSSLAFHPNEACQSKFPLSTRSATRPPPPDDKFSRIAIIALSQAACLSERKADL